MGTAPGQKLLAADLAAFGATWASFTPNLPNLPLSSKTGRYVTHGKTVHVRVLATVSGAATGTIFMDLPVPATSAFPFGLSALLNGNAIAVNQGVGSLFGVPVLGSATQVQFLTNSATPAVWAATAPHTWKSSDTIQVNLTYEAA